MKLSHLKYYRARIEYKSTSDLQKGTLPNGAIVHVQPSWIIDAPSPFVGDWAFSLAEDVYWLPERDLVILEEVTFKVYSDAIRESIRLENKKTMKTYQQKLDELDFETPAFLREAVEEIIESEIERVREEQILLCADAARTVDPYNTFEDSVDQDSILNCERAKTHLPMQVEKSTTTTYFCRSKVEKYNQYNAKDYSVGQVVLEGLSQDQYEAKHKEAFIHIRLGMGYEQMFKQDELSWWRKETHLTIENFRINN